MTATSSLPPFRSPCEAHLVGRAVALQAVRPSAKAGSSASRQSLMPVRLASFMLLPARTPCRSVRPVEWWDLSRASIRH